MLPVALPPQAGYNQPHYTAQGEKRGNCGLLDIGNMLQIAYNPQMTTAIFSFGVFTDLHYGDGLYMDRHCMDGEEKLRACVAAFNERKLPLAIFLGDLIDSTSDHAGEVRNAVAMSKVYATFQGERRMVLGNHDLCRLAKAEFLHAVGACPAEPYYSFDYHGVHFIVLDGNCHEDGSDFSAGNFQWDHAWVSPEQLRWLESDLARYSSCPTIVFIHENLERIQESGALDAHSVQNCAP